MTESAYTTTVDVRYQDHDTFGHVNNAVYVTYLEEARVGYLRDELGLATDDLSMVVAHLEVEFRQSVQYADEVEVAVSVTDVGESSFTMAYEVRDGEDVAVEGETVQVVVDPDTGASAPVPEEWRESIAAAEE